MSGTTHKILHIKTASLTSSSSQHPPSSESTSSPCAISATKPKATQSGKRATAEGPLGVLGKIIIFMVSLTFGGYLAPLLWEIARSTRLPSCLPSAFFLSALHFAPNVYILFTHTLKFKPSTLEEKKMEEKSIGEGENANNSWIDFPGVCSVAMEEKISLCLSDSAPLISC